MDHVERETRRKIQHLAERAIRRGGYQTGRKMFIKTANPFVSLMIIRVMMKLWRRYKNEHNVRVKEYALKGIENYESDKEDNIFGDGGVVALHGRQEEEPPQLQPPAPMISATQLAVEEFTGLKTTPRKVGMPQGESSAKKSLKETSRHTTPKKQ